MTNDDGRLARWRAWIEAHHADMAHVADYEARFVREVLAQIPELDPEDVEPQHPFRDRSGRARRIDFMILSPQKGYALAIELDGYAKILSGYSAWDDLFVRQNALLESLGCLLLRFANKRWLSDPAGVADEVREQLLKQARAHEAREAKGRTDAEAKRRLDAWREEREALQASLADLRRRMAALEADAHRDESATSARSSAAIEEPPAEPKREMPRASRRLSRIAAALAAALACAAGLWLLRESASRSDLPPPALPAGRSAADAPTDRQAGSATAAASAARPAAEAAAPGAPSVSVAPVPSAAIAPADARAHAGEDAVVCGRLAQIRSWNSLTFLNFDAPYPDSPFAAVVADENAHAFAGINRAAGGRLCVSGRIELYNGRPQIQLKEGSQWRR